MIKVNKVADDYWQQQQQQQYVQRTYGNIFRALHLVVVLNSASGPQYNGVIFNNKVVWCAVFFLFLCHHVHASFVSSLSLCIFIYIYGEAIASN